MTISLGGDMTQFALFVAAHQYSAFITETINTLRFFMGTDHVEAFFYV
jgi:hypothetical protein